MPQRFRKFPGSLVCLTSREEGRWNVAYGRPLTPFTVANSFSLNSPGVISPLPLCPLKKVERKSNCWSLRPLLRLSSSQLFRQFDDGARLLGAPRLFLPKLQRAPFGSPSFLAVLLDAGLDSDTGVWDGLFFRQPGIPSCSV